MANLLRILPIDTLMFRDGRPFNQEDEGAGAAESLFPPPPPTLAGAVRLAIAQRAGFPKRDWPVDLVGDGVDWQDQETWLGTLAFGPLMMELGGEFLLPAPAHLGKDNQMALRLLHLPAEAEFASDWAMPDGGRVLYPRAPKGAKGFKALEGHWLTFKGMEAVLEGNTPDQADLIRSDRLLRRESRVGIGVAQDSRRANDGQLYTASFLRLCDEANFCLAIKGLPDSLSAFVQRLGGEHRQAEFRPDTLVTDLPSSPSGTGAYAAIAVSPVLLAEEPEPGARINGLPGELVSACIPKPFMLGGWDSRTRGPLPLRPVIPAGVVFFMRCSGDELPPQGRTRVGLSTKWGFGHCLIGRWPQS
ncbi:CRISPR-associated protein Cmr3 [Rhodobium orientis]|nr:type III-B CRISPR module-associated protein Cmr3 [Rhodobium orientis]MBB4302847.1 CRISPR-associated protein Cmr3 [Rhodobium orientis]